MLLALVAVSGAVAVFRREIDWLTTPALRTAVPASPVSWQRAWTAAAAFDGAGEGAWLWELRRPEGSRFAWVGLFRAPVTPTEVFVDPGSGRRVGARELGYHRGAVAFTLRQLHVRLWMGPWGRALVGLTGVLLVLLGVTGYVLARKAPRGPVAGRRAWSRVHAVVGRWTLWFHVLTGVSGAVLGLEVVPGLVARATGDGAGRRKVMEGRTAVAAGWSITLDDAVAMAERAVPGSVARAVRMDPRRPVVTVSLDQGSPWIARGASEVRVQLAEGGVVSVWDARAAGASGRAYNALDPLHFGYFGEAWGTLAGYAVRVLWCALGLTPAALAVSGTVLWRLRARRRARAAWEADTSAPVVSRAR